MSKRLDENIGAVEYDGLIVNNVPVADVFSVTIRKETAATVLKRGTVLALSGSGTAADDCMVILGTTAASNEVLSANCVLADDVEVGTNANVTALAYRTGHFARNKLIFSGEYTLKPADEEALRAAGILLSDALDY